MQALVSSFKSPTPRSSPRSRRLLSSSLGEDALPVWALALIVLTTLVASACGTRTGDIRGHVGSGEGTGTVRSALLAASVDGKAGIRALGQAISLEGIEVELLRVGDGEDPEDWRVVSRTRPQPDGSFAFSDVETGRYALRLVQPEFGGPAYGVDATDFTLRAGQTVRLVLPLVSRIEVDAPGTGWTVAAPPVLDVESGRILGASGDGVWALDPLAGTIRVLYSDSLFADTVVYSMKVPILVSARGELILLLSDRIVAVDLDLFARAAGSWVLDYDDAEARVGFDEHVRWRMLPADANAAVLEGQYLGSWPSADGNTLYVSLRDQPGWDPREFVPGTGRTLVLNLEDLSLRRVIRGEARAYHPLTDQLVFQGPDGVLLVDASAIRDVGSAALQADLGVAPVPGRPEFLVAWTQRSAQDERVPFLARIDDAANILWQERASTYLGLAGDPLPGVPTFDVSGAYFMLGAQGYRALGDGAWEEVGVQVPPGPAFTQRVLCNRRSLFDPVHRYVFHYDCGDDFEGASSMALLSADQGNIPISLRINGRDVVVDAARGRLMVFSGASASVIHYADPAAADVEEMRTLVAGQDVRPHGQSCGDADPCPGEALCIGVTDTAFTGRCSPNQRNPWLERCGGLTRVACDPGFTCAHDNPTNPESPGACIGAPNRDHAVHGVACQAGACMDGMACEEASGRCVPRACLRDADCPASEVCGMQPQLGLVCLSPGPLSDGELCRQPTDCTGGACVPLLSVSEWDQTSRHPGLQICATPCLANRDCGAGQDCVTHRTPWPLCVDREGPLGRRNAALCTVECGQEQNCVREACRTGVRPPHFPGSGDPVPSECAEDPDCPVPSQCVSGVAGGFQCGLRCQRNRDCPWDAECHEGTCRVQGAGFNDAPSAYVCREGEGCDAGEQCIQVWFFSGGQEPYFCVDEDPCEQDDACAPGETCVGICTVGCHPAAGESADDCPPGWQCVHRDLSDEWSPHTCLPHACDCPPTGGPNAYCALQPEPKCTLHQPCALAACDGTFGPLNPDATHGATCCAPGNPCGLSGQDICACPPSCSWWVPDDCGDRFHGMPETGGASLCPEGWACLATPERPYGWRCIADGQSAFPAR